MRTLLLLLLITLSKTIIGVLVNPTAGLIPNHTLTFHKAQGLLRLYPA